MFFYLTILIFCGFPHGEGYFTRRRNNSKYRDITPLNTKQANLNIAEVVMCKHTKSKELKVIVRRISTVLCWLVIHCLIFCSISIDKKVTNSSLNKHSPPSIPPALLPLKWSITSQGFKCRDCDRKFQILLVPFSALYTLHIIICNRLHAFPQQKDSLIKKLI